MEEVQSLGPLTGAHLHSSYLAVPVGGVRFSFSFRSSCRGRGLLRVRFQEAQESEGVPA
jgi:hypothetical protein